MCKGGKHDVSPILSEDQRVPQNRPSKKAMAFVSALDPDYDVQTSPFAINDVTSRAAQLGIHGNANKSWMRKNPNVPHKRTGNKKKK